MILVISGVKKLRKNKRAFFICSICCFLFHFSNGQHIDSVFSQWNFRYDIRPALYHHIVDSAQSLLNKRKTLIRGLNTKADWIARQNHVRGVFHDILGPFPQKTPLKPVVTGIIEEEDFRVEKIYFESIPGYYVTGAFFLPVNSTKPLPTIIYCSGHDPKAFRSDVYQHVILNYVKKGFAVFAFDPIGQGERKQYSSSRNEFVDCTKKELPYPGNQHFILGMSPAYYFIWDGVRAIDYVLTRPEVDANRIG